MSLVGNLFGGLTGNLLGARAYAPPVPAAQPDGAGGRRRRTAIWPVKYTKYSEPTQPKTKYKPAPARITTQRGMAIVDLSASVVMRPLPWVKGAALANAVAPVALSVEAEATAKGKVSAEALVDMVEIALNPRPSLKTLTHIIMQITEDDDG